MKESNFKDFLGNERNLDRIIRFSAQMRLKDESVSEHSFHTALYAMILADLEERVFKNKVDKEKVLKTALLHDLEECLTGDIIYNFKHTEKTLTEQIKKMSKKFLEDLMKKLPKEISGDYMSLWQNSKDTQKIEGKIIEAADKLEGLIYSLNEFSLGNKAFGKIIKGYQKQFKEINLKSLDFILQQIL